MIGLPNTRRWTEGPRWRRAFGSAALVVVLVGTLPAQASPIRASSQRIRASQQVLDLRSWNAFLSGGPALWAQVHAPPITPRIRQEFNLSVTLPNPTSDPRVEYLIWRRDLNPARFDRYHPTLGPELQNLPAPPTTTPTTSPTTETTTPPTPTVTTPISIATAPPPITTAPVPTPPPTPEVTTPTPPVTTPAPPATVPPTGQVITPPPPAPAPEPGTFALALAFLGAGAWWHRRERRPAATH